MRCALLQAWVGRTSRRRGHNELREERELKETSKPQPAPHCHRTLRFLLRSPFSHISVGQSVVFISVWGASLVHLISWWALVRPSLFRPSLLEHGIRIASCRPVVFGYIPHQTFSSPLSSPLHPTRAPLLTVFFINLRHHVFSFTIFPSPWLSRIFLDRSLKDGGKRERRMRCAVDSSRTLFSFFFFTPLYAITLFVDSHPAVLHFTLSPISSFFNVYVLLTQQQPLSDRKLRSSSCRRCCLSSIAFSLSTPLLSISSPR